MSVIESRWRERQSRYEDGIYFGSDSFVELCGTPDTGYRADLSVPVATLLQATADGWTDLDELCSVETGDFKVVAGATSWEGAGFIAVEQRSTGRLLWLLHLSDAEQFTEVGLDGSTIRAVSGGYPLRYEWLIPIHSPDSLNVTQTHDA